MAWNNGKETRKIRYQQKKEEELCKRCGMSDEAISSIKAFDRKVFLSDRSFYRRTISLDNLKSELFTEDDNENDQINPLTNELIYSDDYLCHGSNWLDEISDPELHQAITDLTSQEKQMVYLSWIAGIPQEIVAGFYHVTQEAISLRLSSIKKKIISVCIKHSQRCSSVTDILEGGSGNE